MHKIST